MEETVQIRPELGGEGSQSVATFLYSRDSVVNKTTCPYPVEGYHTVTLNSLLTSFGDI